ncbi:MAG: ATP-dependent Clp protease ATP-binding subunit [Selenomonadaceae bacterium]|nr:ATP-dependent Clp protease ATP-binding subunit [Selenomonadaceae bacterium]
MPMLGRLRRKQTDENERESKTPMLDFFGRCLNELANEGKIDPVVGREKELKRVVQILARRTKNNPLLIGEPGVGKTAIAEGLARKIEEGNAPKALLGKRIYSLSMSNLVAGSKYRGEFEERIQGIMEEVVGSDDIILFIDEIHTLIGAGSAEGSLDAANILKPALARGELRVIGATTLDEYKKHFERDSALARRFQSVMVTEPTVSEAFDILKGLRDTYEKFHRANFDDEALKASVELSKRYITDRFLPDKAIDVMDEAASMARTRDVPKPKKMTELEEKFADVTKEKLAAVAKQDYETAAKLRDNALMIKNEYEKAREKWESEDGGVIDVTADDIAEVVALWTGVPVKNIRAKESERLLKLEKILKERVIGQEEAVEAVAKAVRRGRAGLRDPKRPIGSFLFLGPTGVGKTELAKALAKALFDSEDALIRFDMSEYMEKYSVSKMVGAPPGYVGHDDGGQLTDKVRQKPYSIILLDEIEKADGEIFNILLQVLDDGRLTDSKGRVADFTNTVIIMTSNVGAKFLQPESTALGFAKSDSEEINNERNKARVMDAVNEIFAPEFLNRLDEMLVFKSLGKNELSKIIDILMKDVKERLKEKKITLTVSAGAKDVLIKEGTDKKYGARPLRRAIRRKIEDELSTLILQKTFVEGDSIIAKKAGKEIVFEKKKAKSA